jgi:hypothetical protein
MDRPDFVGKTEPPGQAHTRVWMGRERNEAARRPVAGGETRAAWELLPAPLARGQAAMTQAEPV